jgi:diguanylate cyclase (GGDEF)-like protein/PAS domain S-box-containing protein
VVALNSELFKEIVSFSTQSVLVIDASGARLPIVYANPAYAATSGYSLAELEGTDWLCHAAADDDASELVQLKKYLACSDPAELNLPFLRKDGDIWLARLKLIPLKSSATRRRFWLVQHRAVDASAVDSAELLKRALGQARRKLASLDRTDPVTGLLSRAHFELLLRRDLAISRREQRSLSLMLFTVPELDIYRRTFGINAVESCLRMIGAQIAGTFRRASDLCARVGEAQLAVVVVNQDESQVRRLVTLVEKKVRNLGLHNPRSRLSRYVVVRGAYSIADPAKDGIDSLVTRAEESLDALEVDNSESAVGTLG